MIKTTIKSEGLLAHKTECLVLFCIEEKISSGTLAELDIKLEGVIKSSFKNKRFEGKLNQTLLLNVGKQMRTDHLLLVGLGKGNGITADKLRQAAGTAAKLAEKSKFKTISFYIPTDNSAGDVYAGLSESGDSFPQVVVEGSLLSLYHFDEYKQPEKEKPNRIIQIILLAQAKSQVSSTRSAGARG
ncbi:MAG TPA: hypothetical protein EYO37_06015, partial [Nitrospina sp.]|nr:hypothetical protein [Nitrospina sp.]